MIIHGVAATQGPIAHLRALADDEFFAEPARALLTGRALPPLGNTMLVSGGVLDTAVRLQQ
eukprot:6365584-Amphidinium_carterae.1